ncbi:hypothetical protein [Devosia sp. FJ2-5-3]|jgi:hypothetical protein|uniref:hypothetical protein n=1 Tax=Devosia sp. FJ2-5-3 TaxID=2976680 RepID=UPI0023D88654|nr:hypothetical protein [Devosia sp. FJ2-5-3]WEJ56838.1 hypothetical protein N0P34_11450 [Devosia sp. FJ2-5-3]
MAAPTELLHKLQIASGTKLWLINVPQTIAEELSAGAEVELVHGDSYYDGVIACFSSAAEVEAMTPRILKELPPDGLLWVAYRKGETGRSIGLTRDRGWEALAAAGYRPVRQVALDAEWSALRFRPKALVKAREGSSFA